jgi:Fur family transcriptional regulator, peroxide stress response regulator
MAVSRSKAEALLREALEAGGHRFTEQRLAVFQHLLSTEAHPTADEVFGAVRQEVPVISLGTVYKSLETLVGVGLAVKLTYGDGSARYDGRTDPHPHARCLACSRIFDLPGHMAPEGIAPVTPRAGGFEVTGYRLEFTGYCEACRTIPAPEVATVPATNPATNPEPAAAPGSSTRTP